jgi:hypothetical protein
MLVPLPLEFLWEYPPLCYSSQPQPRTPEIMQMHMAEYLQEPVLSLVRQNGFLLSQADQFFWNFSSHHQQAAGTRH